MDVHWINWGILIVFGIAMFAISPRARGKNPVEPFFRGKDEALKALAGTLDAMTDKALE